MSQAVALKTLESLTTLRDELLAVGGGARSDFWMQIYADMYARRILRSRVGQQAAVGPVEEQGFPARELEDLIDALDASLTPLKNFILPGGCAAAADLHLIHAQRGLGRQGEVGGDPAELVGLELVVATVLHREEPGAQAGHLAGEVDLVVSEFEPDIARVCAGPDGNAWVETSRGRRPEEPGVMMVWDVFSPEGIFLIMELAEGQDLSERVAALPPRFTAAWRKPSPSRRRTTSATPLTFGSSLVPTVIPLNCTVDWFVTSLSFAMTPSRSTSNSSSTESPSWPAGASGRASRFRSRTARSASAAVPAQRSFAPAAATCS